MPPLRYPPPTPRSRSSNGSNDRLNEMNGSYKPPGRLTAPLVGQRITPALFQGGFVGSPKWFRGAQTPFSWLVTGAALRRRTARWKLPPGAKERAGGKNSEKNDPQGPARVGLRRLGDRSSRQTGQGRRRIRLQAGRQYARHPPADTSPDRGGQGGRRPLVRAAERDGFLQQPAWRRSGNAVAASCRRHRAFGRALDDTVDAGAALGPAERGLRFPVLRPGLGRHEWRCRRHRARRHRQGRHRADEADLEQRLPADHLVV